MNLVQLLIELGLAKSYSYKLLLPHPDCRPAAFMKFMLGSVPKHDTLLSTNVELENSEESDDYYGLFTEYNSLSDKVLFNSAYGPIEAAKTETHLFVLTKQTNILDKIRIV